MALTPAPTALADANWRRLDRIREATIRTVTAQWATDAAVEAAVQAVLAGQAAAVVQIDAYIAAAAAVVLDEPFEPVGLDPDYLTGVRARNGTSLEEVYNRALKAGREDGFQRGVDLLRRNVTTDISLAQRNAAHAARQARPSVAGWRRKVNPGTGQVCGMCVAASTRTYRRGDLQPIHPMCRCTTVEIYDTSKVGQTLDRDRLDAVYARTGGATDFQSLGKIRFTAEDLPPGVDYDVLDALNVRIVNDRELGLMLDADRHDTHFAISA